MCIAVFQWNPESETPLLLAANRDEHFERPTQFMHWWPQSNVLAGRDLKADGAWLGITTRGRFALITNIRTFVDAVVKAKPTGAKGTFLKKVAISSSMGPGVRIEVASATQPQG